MACLTWGFICIEQTFSRKVNKIKMVIHLSNQNPHGQQENLPAFTLDKQSPAVQGGRGWLKLGAGGGCSGSCLESSAIASGRSSSLVQNGRRDWVHLQLGEVQKQGSCGKSFPKCNIFDSSGLKSGNFTDCLWQGNLLMSELKHGPGR